MLKVSDETTSISDTIHFFVDENSDLVELDSNSNIVKATSPFDLTFHANDTAIINGPISPILDVDSLKFLWKVEYQPEGSNITIVGEETKQISFYPEIKGHYVISFEIQRLWEKDGKFYIYSRNDCNIIVEE